MQSTAQALGTRLAATVTADQSASKAKDSLQEAQATATQLASSFISTQTAQNDLSLEAQRATDDAFASFRGELLLYGVDPERGRPGWIHPTLQLELEEYHSYEFANQFMGTIAQDFVLSADITWNTEYGGSGCGFVFRSDGNKAAPNQYMLVAARAANGHVIFTVMADGEVVGGQDLYAYGVDRAFDYHNGAVNRLALVARGYRFNIYTNGTKIGEVDPDAPLPQPRFPSPPPPPANLNDPQAVALYTKATAQYNLAVQKIKADYNARLKAARQANKAFEQGFVAFLAVSESGHTNCQFDRSWLWLMESER